MIPTITTYIKEAKNVNLLFLPDYFRMISYSIVILSAIMSIAKRKYHTILFVGDITMAFLLFVSAFYYTIGIDRTTTLQVILTPAAIIWAITHLINLLS